MPAAAAIAKVEEESIVPPFSSFERALYAALWAAEAERRRALARSQGDYDTEELMRQASCFSQDRAATWWSWWTKNDEPVSYPERRHD